jgi:hypothetical protein
MTIHTLARSAVFEPETIQAMAGAYEEVLGVLQLADRNDPFAEVVAKEVIELARLGIHDRVEIRQRVLNALGEPQPDSGNRLPVGRRLRQTISVA